MKTTHLFAIPGYGTALALTADQMACVLKAIQGAPVVESGYGVLPGEEEHKSYRFITQNTPTVEIVPSSMIFESDPRAEPK